MKYTIHEFAQEIRKKFPGDYDDLTDNKLVELWLCKYPNDSSKIDIGTTINNSISTQQTIAPKESKETDSNNYFVNFIIIVISFTVIALVTDWTMGCIKIDLFPLIGYGYIPNVQVVDNQNYYSAARILNYIEYLIIIIGTWYLYKYIKLKYNKG